MVHVVLFSGGLDSTVLAYHTLYTKCKEGDTLILHAFITNENISVAQYLSTNEVLDDLFVKGAEEGVTVDYVRSPLPLSEYEEGTNAFVPFRNTLFVFTASHIYYANHKHEGVKIYLGAIDNQVEGYGDCTPEFIASLNSLIKVQGEDVEVVAPFVYLTKYDILLIANSFGVPIEKTWSCLYPKWFEEGNPTPCGECIKCKERKDLGIKI